MTEIVCTCEIGWIMFGSMIWGIFMWELGKALANRIGEKEAKG